MNFEIVLNNVCKHVNLNRKEKDYFISLLEPKHLKKKEFQLTAGEICRQSTFVVEGCLKGFSVDKEGVEHILNFACKDWWIADLYSLLSEKPAILNIEAIADTEVLMLSREDQKILYNKIPKFERFFRILTENALVANHQRLINNLSLSAEERYHEFMKKYPTVLEYAPLHSIASYLGITPEFLSKIRSRIARKPA